MTNTYTTLDPAGSTQTVVNGISGNTVVGYYHDASLVYHGFLYNLLTSTYSILKVPGATDTNAFAVSGNNVVGQYDVNGDISSRYAFLYNTYTTLDVPASANTGGHAVSVGVLDSREVFRLTACLLSCFFRCCLFSSGRDLLLRCRLTL